MKKDLLPMFLVTVVSVVAIDRLTKIMALVLLQGRPPFKVLPFLQFNYVTNTGVSFGMLKGFPWIPFTVGVAVVALMSVYYKRIPRETFAQNAAAFIMGGTIGNLWDRVVYGTVIDFIDFKVWPVFNIADSAITIGGIIIAYHLIVADRKRRNNDDRPGSL